MKAYIRGIHPKYYKITRKDKTEVAPMPKKVILPLQQHTGAPCQELVKAGDEVKVGQKIAMSDSFVSAPIHASISGKVIGIEKARHPVLNECKAIIIESNGKIEWDGSIKDRGDAGRLGKDDLRGIIREMGIVGLGGAGFPTHVKLSPPPEKKIDTVILNGAECEPYLTCDYRVMLEHTERIIKGLQVIRKILEPKQSYIGIEDNKENAIALLEDKLEEMGLQDRIEVIRLKTIYPQGAEKNLIYSITQRKVPNKGGLPMDVGVAVQNVQTVKAIYDAVYECKPLIERVVTVTGAVKRPKNLLVKIGTPAREIIEFCGGYEDSTGKIIFGGPMMGIAQYDDDVPLIKGSSGILVQKEEIIKDEERDCIRCGRCIDKCPMSLMPTMISQYAQKDDLEKCSEYSALDCYECGCCSYVCPSKIPLVHWIKYAKSRIIASRKRESKEKNMKKPGTGENKK
ncbi:electron transport complex subunit RsxC [Candidatus Woesearchaeota archaeon]|nr:electron transport complex subunit RsxC [Candidatus Woesearchaeota archaeon]